MDWFVDWFDSAYYHILYRQRDQGEADRFVDNIATRISISNHDDVLDIPCGRGRHTQAIHKKFDCFVTGIDLSPSSIDHAKAHFKDAKIRFGIGDMRTYLPSNGQRYSAIFNLFTSFGYFESLDESRRVLQHFSKLIKPGGILVLDYLNCRKVLKSLPSEKKKARAVLSALDGVVFETKKYREGAKIVKDIEVRYGGETRSFSERLNIIDKKLMAHMMEEARFDIVDFFGDYDMMPYDADFSGRLLVMAVKT